MVYIVSIFFNRSNQYIYIHRNQNDVLFISKKKLYWIDLLKKECRQDCTHVDHNQLMTLTSLPFEIKVYDLMVKGHLSGCGLDGTVLFNFFSFFF